MPEIASGKRGVVFWKPRVKMRAPRPRDARAAQFPRRTAKLSGIASNFMRFEIVEK